MLHRRKKPAILIYPTNKKLHAQEVHIVLSGTPRPLSRILNNVEVHPAAKTTVNKLAEAFSNEINDFFESNTPDSPAAQRACEENPLDLALEKAARDWNEFSNLIEDHPDTHRIASVQPLQNKRLGISLTPEFKHFLPIPSAWKACENLIATVCRLAFEAIFTDDGDYRSDFFKAVEDSFPYTGGCLNRLQEVMSKTLDGKFKLRANLVASAAVYMTEDYLQKLTLGENVSPLKRVFINNFCTRISSQVIPEYTRLRFEKIDKENQIRENFARPRVTNIIEECRRYEGHLLYEIKQAIAQKIQALDAEIKPRQKLLLGKNGVVAKATLENEIRHYALKRNQLVAAYKKPKTATQLPINMIDNMPALKESLEKLKVLNKLKEALSSSTSQTQRLKNFEKIFTSSEMEPIRRAKDSESTQFLKIVGHLLLSFFTGGLYFAGAVVYSLLTSYSPKFWLTPEEIFLQNVDKQLPKPAPPRIKFTKYAD